MGDTAVRGGSVGSELRTITLLGLQLSSGRAGCFVLGGQNLAFGVSRGANCCGRFVLGGQYDFFGGC